LFDLITVLDTNTAKIGNKERNKEMKKKEKKKERK